MDQRFIRNFCIIAHIDHGKSTLADRLLQHTGAISEREMVNQVLDQMDLERERGITIKMQAVRLEYQYPEDELVYQLNLIDTPGHVDFSYEVSRSLAACEGALLVVDAVQGIEAQTLANAYLAIENDLEIIPVINKIDLPGAQPDQVKEELEKALGLDMERTVLTSAKLGWGTPEVLAAIVKYVPPPRGNVREPLRALIFDSYYDSYRGAIPYIRVVDGEIQAGTIIKIMATGKSYEVDEVGIFAPARRTVPRLSAGEVGYLAASIREVKDIRVGDTITVVDKPAAGPLPGYRPVRPMVFCGLYPADGGDFDALRTALDKLQLNDASLVYEPETSKALGFGFRCGFLGLLHQEIVQERLEREYHLELISTAPNVAYRVTRTDGQVVMVDNPAQWPPPGQIAMVEEPVVKATIISPTAYIGNLMDLTAQKRGRFLQMDYLSPERVLLEYILPLGEIIFAFFDQLKSRSRGYASFDYEVAGYEEADMGRLDILLNGEMVDALSTIVHRDKAYQVGRQLVTRLREVIPRQLFEVVIQAAVGHKVIAREAVKPLRKNVLEKCYGGDVTRKKKLLEKQKEGKKRLKAVGNVEIPQEAFLAVLQPSGGQGR
ncbi:MAG: elongation factor 4 [Clostridia bacterium]|nr:MAG: elongation factor 4 [Clostridia bacterium]